MIGAESEGPSGMHPHDSILTLMSMQFERERQWASRVEVCIGAYTPCHVHRVRGLGFLCKDGHKQLQSKDEHHVAIKPHKKWGLRAKMNVKVGCMREGQRHGERRNNLLLGPYLLLPAS